MTALNAARKICVLVLVMTLCPVIWAQEEADIFQGLEEIKDPFKSQLPEPVVIVDNPVEQGADTKPDPYQEPDPVDPSSLVSEVPNVLPGPNIDAFVLKGLVWNTDTPQAIVNDMVVKVGDEVNGIRVVAIRQDGVEFSLNGINKSLSVSKQNSGVAPKP